MKPFAFPLALAASLLLNHICIAEPTLHTYAPPTPPEESVPAWKCIQKQGTRHLERDTLSVETTFRERHFYGIGENKEGRLWGDGEMWKKMAAGEVLELRVKCSADDPTLDVFQLYLRDGERQWVFSFTPTAINKAPADTSDWDTYRIRMEDGLLILSSEKRGDIVKARSTEDDRSRSLFFGTYAYQPEGEPTPRRWDLEFIRWHDKTDAQ